MEHPTYTFDHQVTAWARPPVDEVGYLASDEVATMADPQLRHLIAAFAAARYGGWRNAGNRWRTSLGLDSTHGRQVLDFGCGYGLEALQFARAGNRVWLADLNVTTLLVAERVLRLHGYAAEGCILIDAPCPTLPDLPIDVFYANGVLHHTPYLRQILREAARLLPPEGDIRLMLYSDRAWTLHTGTPLPPVEAEVSQHPQFQRFVRAMDEVGEYADWYNAAKLEYVVGDFLDIQHLDYLTPNGQYIAVTLHVRPAGELTVPSGKEMAAHATRLD